MARTHVLSQIETGTTPHWGSAVWAGLIAGLVFVVMEMLLVSLVAGGSAWGPPRMIAGIVMGRDVVTPATFDFGVIGTGVVVHFVLSAILGALFSWLVFRLETPWAVVAGAILGLVLYWVNFYGFTALFPWFAGARGGITLLSHIVFGLVLAWSYKGLASRKLPAPGEHREEV